MASGTGPIVKKLKGELEKGASLAKCRRCGCMRGTLEEMKADLAVRGGRPSERLRRDVSLWLDRLEGTRYT